MDCTLKIACKCYQIVGIDILLDEDYNAWLIEINSSPNISICETSPFDESERYVSEIDKEIKLPMMCDALKLADIYLRDSSALDHIDQFHSLTKIYANSTVTPNEDLSVLHNLKIIYDTLAGDKGIRSINLDQFANLYNLADHVRQGPISSEDFSVVFSSIVGRDETQLSFANFTDAMYELFAKYKGKSLLHLTVINLFL